jgi:hypothetical protein
MAGCAARAPHLPARRAHCTHTHTCAPSSGRVALNALSHALARRVCRVPGAGERPTEACPAHVGAPVQGRLGAGSVGSGPRNKRALTRFVGGLTVHTEAPPLNLGFQNPNSRQLLLFSAGKSCSPEIIRRRVVEAASNQVCARACSSVSAGFAWLTGQPRHRATAAARRRAKSCWPRCAASLPAVTTEKASPSPAAAASRMRRGRWRGS